MPAPLAAAAVAGGAGGGAAAGAGATAGAGASAGAAAPTAGASGKLGNAMSKLDAQAGSPSPQQSKLNNSPQNKANQPEPKSPSDGMMGPLKPSTKMPVPMQKVAGIAEDILEGALEIGEKAAAEQNKPRPKP